MQSKQSIGGKISSIVQRTKALENYYLNPNYCKECNTIIEIGENKKVSQIKLKKFCNNSCSAKYNNKNRIIIKQPKPPKIKKLKQPYTSTLRNKSKKEIFDLRSSWQSARTAIRKDAIQIFKESNQPLECKICKYKKHVQIAHIKAVSDFNDSSLLSEINDLSNLVALCPTHHWEYDHNCLDTPL